MKTLLITCVLTLSLSTLAVSSSSLTKENSVKWMQNHPVKFLENRGQMTDMDGKPVPFVLFKAEVPGLNLFITEQGLTIQTLEMEEEEHDHLTTNNKESGEDVEGSKGEWERIDVVLKNATIGKENIITEGTGITDFNFFYPHCPNGIYGVKEYEKVTIKNVYPGIDWVLYNSNDKGFKYDFVVNPGADYKQVELLYRSKEPVVLNRNGQIELHTKYGNITEHEPVSFLNGRELKTKFNLKRSIPFSINNDSGYETSISFNLASDHFPAQETLTIDPQLVWATFYGGNQADGPYSADADNNDNLFTTGYTWSANFPVCATCTGYFNGVYVLIGDVFLNKFSNTGVRLWATFYSGSGSEEAYSVAADAIGNVFVTGRTRSTDFPVCNGVGCCGTCATGYYQAANAGSDDVFILKFDNNGVRIWATYYGGTGLDYGYSIATDASGNVFVTGYTSTNDFPVCNGAACCGTCPSGFYQAVYAGGRDAFILKFDNNGNRLWATFYGGTSGDTGYSITTDASGDILVTGYTQSTNFPVCNGAACCSTCPTGYYQATNGGLMDAFILKFDTNGNRLWSTYYGGSKEEYGYTIAADASGNIYVMGSTASANLPVCNTCTGYFKGTLDGFTDAFILKFTTTGTQLWATYFGGTNNELRYLPSYDNIETDKCGNVYVSINTESEDVPVKNSCDAGYQDNTFNGPINGNDLAVMLFDNTNTLLWSTYLGGDGYFDFREALAIDSKNSLFMTGEWATAPTSATYPIVNPGGGAYYDSTPNGSDDGYILKLKQMPIIATIVVNKPSCGSQCTGNVSVNIVSPAACTYRYLWSNGITTSTAAGLCIGNYTVTITNNWCKDTILTVNIMGNPVPSPSVTATAIKCNGGVATVTATANEGISPYTFNWSTGDIITGATSIIPDLLANTYSVTVTDANGCTNAATIVLVSPPPLSGLFTKGSANCTSCGCIEWVMINGVGGTEPYTYTWIDGYDKRYKNKLCPGNYLVNIKDKNGCSVDVSVTTP